MSYWTLFAIVLFLWLIVFLSTRYILPGPVVRLNVWVGIAAYGVLRVVWHWTFNVLGGYIGLVLGNVRYREREPARPKVASSVSEILSVHELPSPFQVVLGFRGRNRPIKVDLKRHHTLIGASTGSGKTNLLNSILIQLFGKGSYFTSVADVYLIDLKGDEYDYLNLWTPLLTGYATIDSSGIGSAIDMLSALVARMESGQRRDRHVVLIIDEMAMLTAMATDKEQARTATALLNRIMGQFRTWGTVVGAVQYARYDIVPTPIRANMDRKICLPVESKDHAKVVLGFRPEKHELPWKPGQFLLNEPGVRKFIHGQSMLVRIPDEIEATVRGTLVGELDDPRLKLFHDIAGRLVPGASPIGVRKIAEARDDFTQSEVQTAYRNYALAGALTAPERAGQSYILTCDYLTALGRVKTYIGAGMWQSAPSAFVETNGRS